MKQGKKKDHYRDYAESRTIWQETDYFEVFQVDCESTAKNTKKIDKLRILISW